MYTVRSWPFDDADYFGKNRDGKDFYEFDESRYRLHSKVGETDQLMNIQELFIESAIDDPGLFEGYTHFNDNVGFRKQKRDENIDKFMECVKLIEPKRKSSDKGNLCYPHPKWLELRRRIDNAERDNKGRWDVTTVFKEAAKVTDFGKWKQGKHYFDGIGFVETTNKQKGKEHARVREIQTRSTSDTKQDEKMKNLINTIRGYPFGEKNMLGKDQNNSSKQFNKENEFVYRVQDATAKIKDDEPWYLKEVFWEAAMDNQDLFYNYTHFSKGRGFIKGNEKTEFDTFIEYIKMIDKKRSRGEEQNSSNPHHKLYEFRKRVDSAQLDDDNLWKLNEVFKEAASKKNFGKGLKGMHYKYGMGLVMTMNNNKVV